MVVVGCFAVVAVVVVVGGHAVFVVAVVVLAAVVVVVVVVVAVFIDVDCGCWIRGNYGTRFCNEVTTLCPRDSEFLYH